MVEDVEPFDATGKDVIVVWPHSHASMNVAFINSPKSRMDIVMPCCYPIPNNWMNKIHSCYRDEHVLSPKNIIHVFESGD
jgi:hypothetical protein